MKSKKETAAPSMVEPTEQKPSANFNLGKKSKLPKITTGEVMTITVHGKVKGFRDDPFGRSFEIEIDEIETDSGIVGDMKSLKKKRTLLNEKEPDADEG